MQRCNDRLNPPGRAAVGDVAVRPKARKLAAHPSPARVVAKKLVEDGSPEQRSGRLRLAVKIPRRNKVWGRASVNAAGLRLIRSGTAHAARTGE